MDRNNLLRIADFKRNRECNKMQIASYFSDAVLWFNNELTTFSDWPFVVN